jgi:hypothetical protein
MNQVLRTPSTHSYIYIDGLLSVATVQTDLTFFHIPERSIALVKRLAGSQRAEIDPNLLR